MKKSEKHLQRERATVETMIHYYCRHKHGRKNSLCDQCTELLHYARKRLRLCPFQEGKTTCGKCPVHCYQPGMRQQIKEVMRYTGPRMVLSHPVMALRHMIDGLRKKPVLSKKQ